MGSKLLCLQWKIVVHGKRHTCRLILLIDKAIIHGKRFMTEWRTTKTVKVFPLEHLIYYFVIY